MYKSFLLKNGFWTQKNSDKILLKHDDYGSVYAIIEQGRVKIVANRATRYFTNFTELENYLAFLKRSCDFTSILKKIALSRELRGEKR